MTTRIPPLLTPYICDPPQHSFTVVTGLLGASANWLVLRYLSAALGNSNSPRSSGPATEEGWQHNDTAVVLVSWMRDFEFWKTEARRAVGLDLSTLGMQNRFIFVDGLTHLYVPPEPVTDFPPTSTSPIAALPVGTISLPRTVTSSVPARPLVLPHRGPPAINHSASIPSPTSTAYQSHDTASGVTEIGLAASQPIPSRGIVTITETSLSSIESTILSAINSLSTPALITASTTAVPRKVILILDQPTTLLHTSSPAITSSNLSNIVHALRSHVHATVLSVPADKPFLAPAVVAALKASDDTGHAHSAATTTALESDTASFIVGAVMQARCVVGCRKLGTGWAGDVSGIVRVTRGGAVDDADVIEVRDGNAHRVNGGKLSEGEWLYFVGGDGAVKVWERGAAME